MTFVPSLHSTLLVLLTGAASGTIAQSAIAPVVPPRAAPFSPADVHLLDGPFKLSRDAAARYLLSLDMDRLLAPYLIESGLKPKAPPYPGWETTVLPGVGLGFYLSGISYLAAGTGEREFTRRLNYILDELEACQQATGGYLLGTRNGRAIFARIEKEGRFKGFAPWSDGWPSRITRWKKSSRGFAMLTGSRDRPGRCKSKSASAIGWTGTCHT